MHAPATFDRQTMIVTGAGSGIGLATTERLVAGGATVIAVDISRPRLDAVATVHGDAVRCIDGDLADEETISRIMEAAGPEIDGLANVAGIMDGFEPTAEISDETWERVFAVRRSAPNGPLPGSGRSCRSTSRRSRSPTSSPRRSPGSSARMPPTSRERSCP